MRHQELLDLMVAKVMMNDCITLDLADFNRVKVDLIKVIESKGYKMKMKYNSAFYVTVEKSKIPGFIEVPDTAEQVEILGETQSGSPSVEEVTEVSDVVTEEVKETTEEVTEEVPEEVEETTEEVTEEVKETAEEVPEETTEEVEETTEEVTEDEEIQDPEE